MACISQVNAVLVVTEHKLKAQWHMHLLLGWLQASQLCGKQYCHTTNGSVLVSQVQFPSRLNSM